MIRLSKRLQMLADSVPKGSALADIGTDHGYLPIYLLQSERISHAIASDVRLGPLNHAKQNAKQTGLLAQVDLRQASGLDAVLAEECNVITIAGMGGDTIAEILQHAPWTREGNHLLLLQPQTKLPELRQFLYASGYAILQEQICNEEKHTYLIWQVQGGYPPKEKALFDCYLSDVLLKAKGARAYCQRILFQEQKILQGMKKGNVEQNRIERQEQVVHTIKQSIERCRV